ncbi:AMP-binding protein [Amycolatopsis sp. NPDC023774]|uniref:AMP-binding protein n=1 Tax=Amycolatopsis sp. NPDC023774 TaxID=3155015 RepID=UPI0033C03852
MSSAQRYLDNGTERERTFAQLHEDVDRVATRLRDHAGRGDKVALLAPASPEWTICDLAIARTRAICVPIHPTSTPRQISWIREDSGAVAAFAGKPGRITTIPVLGTEIPGTQPNPGPRQDPRPDDVAAIVDTSGTTGDPKGCVLTHGNSTSIVATPRQLTDVGPDDVPFAYLLTRMLQYFCLDTGATITYSRGNIRTVLTELAEVAPTYAPSVPARSEKIHTAIGGLEVDETRRTRLRQAFGGRLKPVFGLPRQPPGARRGNRDQHRQTRLAPRRTTALGHRP